ncbi:MAG: NAD(P)-binding domain-containing protein, partial [Pseudomonadota bacterium]
MAELLQKREVIRVTEKIGFIGLGDMGRPMAERLLRGRHELQVYDIDPR